MTKLGPRLAGDVEADAIVSLWWPDEELLMAGLGSEQTATAWQDVPNYAQTDGTFWVCREHVADRAARDGPWRAGPRLTAVEPPAYTRKIVSPMPRTCGGTRST